MYLPRFLVSATVVLAVLLIWTYYVTGSCWYSLIWTALGALVLQLGYFLAVGFLIFRSGAAKLEQLSARDEERVNLFDGTGSLFH
ncbi:hypothetical protein DBIPINDM_007542 (plasmid) [Mesorhizobium sp. AR02]|uniref:exopolysaccharide production repressor protein n=1 Tax=Mesorhizobium sp. AR02 TaxID=2865837 RepID=UPI00215EEB1C|nr:exopolysaccharide production repressor protein [Mesorhizobium sp. AR02]UVK50230.1 hypothetical protein DBIPINDM_007542 [Mesorhizobium sp. AR02]